MERDLRIKSRISRKGSSVKSYDIDTGSRIQKDIGLINPQPKSEESYKQ